MLQIEVINLTKIFSVDALNITAVNNVSLKINKGEFLSIVGHSGSGKTTLLSVIGGIVRPSSGSVFFEGIDIHSLDSYKLSEYRCKKIGFMFQFASLLPVLTARENLLLPTVFRAKGSYSDKRKDEKKAIELLSRVGLGDKVNAYASQLSGGQQRRVAIARAFMNEPEVILADEPTGDLDEETEAEMMRFFKEMNEERNITFIMVTHNTDIAKQAMRQLRMSNGLVKEL